MCDALLAPGRVLTSHSTDQLLELRRDTRPARLAFPTPEKLEAFAMPTDEGLGRHEGQGVSPIEASAEPHERQAGWIVESARPDLAFLIEGELFAQEEILGGKRGFGA